MPQKANLISPRSCTRKTFKFVKPFVVSNEFREARTPRRSSSRACFNARNSVKSVKASGYQYASFTFRPPPIWKILQDKSWNKSSLNCFVPRISSTNSQQLLRLLLQVGTAENQPEKTYSIKFSWEENSRYYCQCHSWCHCGGGLAFCLSSFPQRPSRYGSMEALNAQLVWIINEFLSERLRMSQ